MKLGVCCIINELRDKDIFTGRTCKRATFSIQKANDLALQNCLDLMTCLEYCKLHNIKAFRVGSDIFPRITEQKYTLNQLKDHKIIQDTLCNAGKYAHDNGITLSCHPGPFTILGSKRDDVNTNGITEVEYHSMIGDLLSQDVPNMQFVINIHIGCKYSQDVIPIFTSSFNKLSETAKKRLTLENDDKASSWSISKLMTISSISNIPLVFDLHHSQFSRESHLSPQEEFVLAKSTWKNTDLLQEIHVSESADTTKNIPAHSDLIQNKIPDWLSNDNVYVLLEAKHKEKAVFHYREKYGTEI